ncbi:MAG TPA: ABC transporter substrate-binding protein, partial [Candidatus Kapabacteria bacterium]|nr:ABC transporter substrate-binding protein [Candidatus Kapabacteria bacterium]
MPKHVLDPTGLTDQFTVVDCVNNSKAKKKPMSDFADWFSSTPCTKDPKYLIGSGPYVVKEWITDDRVIAQRNPDYWNRDAKWGKAYPDKIVMKFVNDFNAAITALKGGDLDIVTSITPQLYVHELDTQKDKQIAKDAYFIPVYYYIGWNEQNPLFADSSVRQALTYLCDTKTMIDKVMFGLARPIFGPTYFMRKECDPTLKPYEYNPDKAKQLLKDAGWKDSDGDGILDKTINGKKVDFKFTMMINSGNDIRKQTALILAEELRNAGIQMEVQTLDFTVELQDLREHKFDAYIGAWSMPTDAPDEYQIWHSSQISGGSNYVCYKNKEVDSIIDADRTEFDESKRIALMREFQQILYVEQPYTFLWTPKERVAYSSRFQNIHWYAISPGYDPQTWWVPNGLQRYGVAKN